MWQLHELSKLGAWNGGFKWNVARGLPRRHSSRKLFKSGCVLRPVRIYHFLKLSGNTSSFSTDSSDSEELSRTAVLLGSIFHSIEGLGLFEEKLKFKGAIFYAAVSDTNRNFKQNFMKKTIICISCIKHTLSFLAKASIKRYWSDLVNFLNFVSLKSEEK